VTGEGEGKVRLECNATLDKEKIEAKVFIHMRGHSEATVTHLDVESPALNIHPGKGEFGPVLGIEGGIKVLLCERRVRVLDPRLNDVLPQGKRTFTWIGQKQDGIFVGFKKGEMQKLEELGKALLAKDTNGGGDDEGAGCDRKRGGGLRAPRRKSVADEGEV
jgi:hypothetical protein